jgi:hypothetical protein
MTGWRRTHCIRGHEWTPENTQVDSRGKRHCRACLRAYRLRNAERLRASARAAHRERVIAPEVRARRNARERERYASDPEYRARVGEARRVRQNAKYASDPEYRERRKAQIAALWASNPAYYERAKEQVRARYANDPEYRERAKARSRANGLAARNAALKPI